MDFVNKLQQQHDRLSLKAGTEWEDMDYQEIACLQSLGQAKLPLIVKIAGPEANAGCQILDGTVNGLGLGSGNNNLVHALSLVQQRLEKHYNHAPLDARHSINVPIPAEKSYLYCSTLGRSIN